MGKKLLKIFSPFLQNYYILLIKTGIVHRIIHLVKRNGYDIVI